MRLVVIILAVLIAGCGDKVQQSPYKTGELIILTRVGSITYSLDETGAASSFDYELARLLAQELGLKSRIVVAASDADILHRLKSGEGHLAAAWLTAVNDAQIRSCTPYFQSQNVLITHEASLPLTGVEQLAHKTIHVVAGSRQETALLAVKEKVPDLIIAADHLGVSNRLDPAQSIHAGALYVSDLRDTLPPSVGEPDRLWLALAAYNLGMGHLNAARHIAIAKKADPDSWYEMKKVLPLLAQPQYYSRLKSGRGRGGEAVTLVENIRIYTDILYRHDGPYRPLDRLARTTEGNKSRLQQSCNETLGD